MATSASASPIPFLETLASSPLRADRAIWLRVVLDALRQPGPSAISFGPDVLANFARALSDLDSSSQVAVVQRLCSLNNAPRGLWDVVLSLGGEPRRLAISRAGRVDRETLMLSLNDPALAAAVASRADLDAEMVDRILRIGRYPALVALAENSNLKLEASQLVTLAEIAREEGAGSELGAALLGRSPICAQYAPLFLQAASPQRVQILLALQRQELGRESGSYTGASSVDRLAELEQLAMEGSQAAFARRLADLLICDEVLAERIASDPFGEPLAAVLAAHGAAGDVSVRILTARDLSDGADKYRRLGSLIRLRDALSPNVARKVVAAMVGHDLRPLKPATSPFMARPRAADVAARVAPSVERPMPQADAATAALAPRLRSRPRFAS